MMRKTKLIAAIPVLLAASACVPAIENAEFETALSAPQPIEWRTNLAGQASISRDWWRGIGDPNLNRLVEEARANNVDIQIAATRVRQAQAMEVIARSALVPSIGALGLGSRSSNDAFGRTSRSTGAQGIARISYEIDFLNRVANSVDAAEAGVAGQMAAQETAQIAVTAAVVRTYVTLVSLDAQLETLEGLQKVSAESLALAREQRQQGYASNIATDRAESAYLAVSEQIPVVKQAIAQAENALSYLTGSEPRTIARASSLSALSMLDAPVSVPSDLVRNRPDIAAAEFQVAASDKQLAIARAQFLPRIQLSALLGLAESSILNNGLTLWSAGGSVLAPIFQGGRLQGNFDNAQARRIEAAHHYRGRVLQAFREVEDALSQVAHLQDQAQVMDERLEVAQEAEQLAVNRFESGYSPKHDPLGAKAQRLDIELASTQLLARRMNASVTLYQALGGGWDGASSAVSDAR